MTITVADSAAMDAAGNGNVASNTFSIVYQSEVTGLDDIFGARGLNAYPVPANQDLKLTATFKKPVAVSLELTGMDGTAYQT